MKDIFNQWPILSLLPMCTSDAGLSIMFQFYLPFLQSNVVTIGLISIHTVYILAIWIIANYIKSLQFIFTDKISIIEGCFTLQFPIRHIFMPCVETKLLTSNRFILRMKFYVVRIFQVLAVFASTMLAQLGSFFIFKESVERIFEPHHIHEWVTASFKSCETHSSGIQTRDSIHYNSPFSLLSFI